jgi:hypothetical protein
VGGTTQQEEIARLESLLVADLRVYLDARKRSPGEAQEHIPSLMAILEHLLQSYLEGCEGWKRSYFIDGISPAFDMIPDCFTVTGDEIRIRGRADWCGESKSWIEPFYAVMRLTPAADTLSSYTLCFGDSALGLATVPYGKHLRRADWFFPETWLFAFTNGN